MRYFPTFYRFFLQLFPKPLSRRGGFFFFVPAGGYAAAMARLKMDGYLFWTPVAPAMLTTNCLEKNDMIIKCNT